MIKQFIKFGIVGGINTVLSYAIYYIGIKLGINYILCNAIAFAITVFISYMLNGMFVFQGEDKWRFDFLALLKVYASYSVTSLFLSSALLGLEVELLHIPEEIGPILNLFVTIPINFLLNKFWAYRKKDRKDTLENE